jgi:hypothetical protein
MYVFKEIVIGYDERAKTDFLRTWELNIQACGKSGITD